MPNSRATQATTDPDLGVALAACALLLAGSSLASVTAAVLLTLVASLGTGVLLGAAVRQVSAEVQLPILAVLVTGVVSAGALLLMALRPALDVSPGFVLPVVAASALALAGHARTATDPGTATTLRRGLGACVGLAAAMLLWSALRERLAVPAPGGLVFLGLLLAAGRAWRVRRTA